MTEKVQVWRQKKVKQLSIHFRKIKRGRAAELAAGKHRQVDGRCLGRGRASK